MLRPNVKDVQYLSDSVGIESRMYQDFVVSHFRAMASALNTQKEKLYRRIQRTCNNTALAPVVLANVVAAIFVAGIGADDDTSVITFGSCVMYDMDDELKYQ
uniref:Uncharacterized protein n=1 Tax=Glossina austeni TaxID=7395 RepID=A0A1A9VV73_GLOAU